MTEFWKAAKETCVGCVGLTPAVWTIAIIAFVLIPSMWWIFLIGCMVWPAIWFVFGIIFSILEGD